MKSLLPFRLLKVQQPVFSETPPDGWVALFIYFFWCPTNASFALGT